MAMVVRRNFSVTCFCFVQALLCVLASQITGDLRFSPSIVSVNLHQIDGSYVQNEELDRTVYHIQKRSPVSPAKKASASLEKKFPPKDSVSVQLEKFKADAKNASSENSTMSHNASVVDVATNMNNSAHELYNVSATDVPVASTNSTTASPTSSSTTTVSSTVSTVSSTASSVTTTADIMSTIPANYSNATVDHHVYYNSTIYLDPEKAMAYWVNFDDLPEDKVVLHRMLSDSHRRAATVTLSFDFPFYGHPLRNITIATGGFIYMGDYMHSWLAATQYIAPLMANFDTSLSKESTVRYFDNGTAFVIEWREVTLQDEKKGGNFTFQTTLLNNGNIIFVYEVIPVSVTEIGDDAHPVKVGLSDAYVIDRIIYFIRRKTIYEYHRIDMKKEEIGNHTAIYFTALTTCLSFHDCKSCMGADVTLSCVWCDSARRCSDGLDRNRQEWLESKCSVEKSSVNCSALPEPDVNPYVQSLTVAGEDSGSIGVGSVIAILLILAVVMGGLLWVGYAYRNPHTSSGQLLIRYRPSQWRFRSGEARYTAASVHM